MVMARRVPSREVTPWMPFQEMEDLRRSLGDFWSWPMVRRFPFDGGEFMPAIDMYEKDNKYIVKAELPGLKEEDVDVSVVGDRLTIKGEKKTESEVEEEDYYRSERSYGSFFRSIDLPQDANADKVEANFENGVLEVSISKIPAAKPKKVTVSARKKEKSTK
jgi:HSP20 family protein